MLVILGMVLTLFCDILMTMQQNIQPPADATPEYMEWVEHITGRNWPVVIDGPGQYLTRGGKRVVIQEHHRDTVSTFKASGSLIMREKPLRKQWQIWKPNGQFRAIGESEFDIVSKLDNLCKGMV